MKEIRFGGPNLPEGRHTWYETWRDGRHVQVRANPGDVTEASKVLRWGLDGPANAADYYVNAGMAEYVTPKKRTKKTEAKDGPEPQARQPRLAEGEE